VKKQFSPEQRADAVARALSGDETKRQVARDVGVSETTLYRWIEAADRPSNVAPLRAVPPPAEPERHQPRTIAEAASSGDYRSTLVKLRDRLAKQLDDANTPPRDMAALSRRFLEVVRELQALDTADGGDEIGKAASADDEAWDSSAI
jgi:transposase-like protein